jgi:hypothetical protein
MSLHGWLSPMRQTWTMLWAMPTYTLNLMSDWGGLIFGATAWLALFRIWVGAGTPDWLLDLTGERDQPPVSTAAVHTPFLKAPIRRSWWPYLQRHHGVAAGFDRHYGPLPENAFGAFTGKGAQDGQPLIHRRFEFCGHVSGANSCCPTSPRSVSGWHGL